MFFLGSQGNSRVKTKKVLADVAASRTTALFSKCSFYRLGSNAVQCPFHVSLFIRVSLAVKMSLTLAACRRLGALTLQRLSAKVQKCARHKELRLELGIIQINYEH